MKKKVKNINKTIIFGDDAFGCNDLLNAKLSNLQPSGEVGQLWKVNYVPQFMQSWRLWQINIGCWVLNHLPNKISRLIEYKL